MMRVKFTLKSIENKARYTASLVACGWAGTVQEKVTTASGQEPYTQKARKRQKSKKGTDQQTDGPTWRIVESRSTRLKTVTHNDFQDGTPFY